MPLLVGLAYYLGAQFAFLIGTLSDQVFALFWPPNVILFCALLFRPRREWPALIAAAFVAHVIAEIGVGMPLPQLLVAFVTNCLVALLNAYGVRRLLDPPPWLGTFQRMGIYILITAGISPAVAALGGAFVPILGGGPFEDYWLFWSLWYLANALPSVTLGPVLLIWLTEPLRWPGWKAPFQLIEPAAIAVALIAISLLGGRTGREVCPPHLPAGNPAPAAAAHRLRLDPLWREGCEQHHSGHRHHHDLVHLARPRHVLRPRRGDERPCPSAFPHRPLDTDPAARCHGGGAAQRREDHAGACRLLDARPGRGAAAHRPRPA